MHSLRILISILAFLVTNLTQIVYAHSSPDDLIIESGYLWFPKDHKINSAIITNSAGMSAVDKCDTWDKKRNSSDFLVIKDSEDAEELILKLDKDMIEDYLPLIVRRNHIKKGLEIISALATVHDSSLVDVSIKKFISVKINTPYTCPPRTDVNALDCKVDIVDLCNKKLSKLPEHYFSNDQLFVLTESIYPKSITLGSGENSIELETIVNSNNVNVNQDIWPLVSKIQYITKYSDEDTHTGPASAQVRTSSAHKKRKSASKKKIKFHWKGR